MKITPIVAAFVSLGLLSSAVSAASLDFRHQYNHHKNEQSSRIKMGNTFDNNVSVSLEVKFKSEDPTDFFNNLINNGTEIGLGYNHVINDQWSLQPGMPIEFRSDNSGTTYKPQLRLTYKPSSIEGFSVSGRYRLDIKDGAKESYERYRHRATLNLGYSMDQWRFGYEANYYKSADSDYLLYDNKDSNYEQNLTVHYSMGEWTPWLEFGDVSTSSESSTRELRSRIGIAYKF